MQVMEGQYDVTFEDLFNQTVKLEEMEKKAGNAESEVSALRSRMILLQENNEEQIDGLDKQLSESKITLADSESKYEDISRKL